VTTDWRPAGAHNFRDLGGLPTEDGCRTRPGVLFRSDTVQELTEDDVDVLVHRLGLRLIVDLRGPAEVEREGRGLLADFSVRHVNVPLDSKDERAIPDLSADTLVRHYLGYLQVSAGALAEVFRMLSDDGLPAVVHCAAGKDRTGVTTALLLRAVGVPVDVVAEDYALSGPAIPQILARLRRLPSYADRIDLLPADVHACDARTMAEFLVEVDQEFGSVSGFLRAAGVEPAVVDRLRARLVQGPEAPSDGAPG
jgi:protein-tyrosine phosphatase